MQIPDSEKMKIDALHLKRPVIISQASIALHLPHRPKYVRELHLMLLPLLLLMDIYIKVPAPAPLLSASFPQSHALWADGAYAQLACCH